MQHEPGLAAEQPRRIGAQRQIGSDPLLGVTIRARLCVAFGPAALHYLRLPPGQGCPGGQSLPRTRRLHHPDRRGRSAASSSSVLTTIGCVDSAGARWSGGAWSFPTFIGAGSRTVQRRRGTSVSRVSEGREGGAGGAASTWGGSAPCPTA